MVGAFRRYASAVLTQHGGVIGETRGLEIFAYFGYPTAQVNDTERAVRALSDPARAHTAQRRQRGRGRAEAFSTHRPRMRSRGDQLNRRDDWRRIKRRGESANSRWAGVGARHHQRSAPDPGPLRGGGMHRKGPGRPVPPVNLFRIVRASGGRRRAAARAPTPFVGREPELRLMARRWERVQAGEGQLS